MLWSVCSDLIECGHEVHTVLTSDLVRGDIARAAIGGDADPPGVIGRLTEFTPSGLLKIHSLEAGDTWLDQWIAVSKQADITLVIAPEIENELSRIVKALRDNDCAVHASSLDWIELASDKSILALRLPSEFNHPPTATWKENWIERLESETASYLTRTKFPQSGWVRKESLGAGCYGVDRLRTLDECTPSEKASNGGCLVQPWIEGVACSASFLFGSSPRLIDCMMQEIRFSPDASGRIDSVSYHGSFGPILRRHHQAISDRCIDMLSHLQVEMETENSPTSTFLQGWIGVDFVLAGMDLQSLEKADEQELLRRLVMIEINPRLTTSFTALRHVHGPRLAEQCVGLSDGSQSNEVPAIR